jgi:ATP-dependent DNA helicase RecG
MAVGEVQANSLSTPVEQLTGVGSRYSDKLRHLGIETLQDLLLYFPRRYDDFSQVGQIGTLKIGDQVTIRGQIIEILTKRAMRRRMTITEALISDESGALRLVWFNQPYLTKTLQKGDHISVSGQVEYSRGGGIQITSPSYEKLTATPTHTGGLVPIYSETEGLSSKWLRALIKRYLNDARLLEEPLPSAIRSKYRLMGYSEAVQQLHFPKTAELLERAQRRISVGELLLLQLRSLYIKRLNNSSKAAAIPFEKEHVELFLKLQSFGLTNDQRKASWGALLDMESGVPMNRLLEGDVGSGKTAVAMLLLTHVALSGYQGVLLVPSTLLATQHFKNYQKQLERLKLRAALVTSKKSQVMEYEMSKDEVKRLLKLGEVNLVIGTHALLQEDLNFTQLGLVVIDEQHRFGVEQRARLRKENGDMAPHLLSMTATPIPRTLALTAYGDLDLSVLHEIPGNRPKVKTEWVKKSDREKAYEHVREEIASGRQVFVVCPLIEESDTLGVRSATEVYDQLSKESFKGQKLALLHGRIKQNERDQVMQEFAGGKIDILVATSVIEVGIDIPNATIMLIEGAERFGLAQLHQIRGRVGRGAHPGHCYLFTETDSESVEARIHALISSEDGFDLAEKDLALRGPGELLGLRQSGEPDLRVASLLDAPLIEEARKIAGDLLKDDPELKNNPALSQEVANSLKSYHPE